MTDENTLKIIYGTDWARQLEIQSEYNKRLSKLLSDPSIFGSLICECGMTGPCMDPNCKSPVLRS